MLPPERVPTRSVGRRPDREAVDERLGVAADAALVEPGRGAEVVDVLEHEVVARPISSGTRRAWRSSGMRPTPAAMTCGRAGAGHVDLADEHATRRRAGACPQRTSTSSLWPLPDTPATPRISPAVDLERRRPAAPARPVSGDVQPVDAQEPAVRPTVDVGRGPLARRRSAGRPSSRPAPARRSSPGALCRRATPPRSTLTRSADRAHLAELVADEDDRQPSATSRRSVANSASTSCGTSTAVGSSRMSTRQSRCERLQDLDALLLADREVARRAPSDRPRMPKRSAASRHAAAGARRGRPEAVDRPERDVLGDRHRPRRARSAG